ncbi:MAG: hypothetical protein ACHQAX_09665 [Gammaproteobacteria bacterium]
MKYFNSCLVKKLSRHFVFALIAILPMMLQGCIVAAIGAGIGAAKYGSAKQQEADVACKNSYNNYLERMEGKDKKPMTLYDYCGKP